MAQLPTDSKTRKETPLARGLLDYFPAALAAVAQLSRSGNEKHNPGEDMHHARGKSSDHADCILRHLVDRGAVDPEDGILHDVKVAWRALAMLQEALEAQGAPLARGARLAPEEAAEELTQLDPPIMVPVGTRVYDECENNIHQRIAGDTPTAQRIKNQYYKVFAPGACVECDDGWSGVIVRVEDDRGATVLWDTLGDTSFAGKPFTTYCLLDKLKVS